jgi:ribonuclease P protein component
MVLHYLSDRPVQTAGGPGSDRASRQVSPTGARAGFVVGKAVGNSVVRHRVTRRLRAAVREELHRLPPTADLVVRARPEAAAAGYTVLRRDLAAGMSRLLGDGSASS